MIVHSGFQRAAVRLLVLLGIFALCAGPGCSGRDTSSGKGRSGKESRGSEGAGPRGSSPGEADWASVRTDGSPPDVILITLDTTRRDRLSCYGFAKKTTPNLDRIAAEGILFQTACTPVPVTLAAHASIMTGQYPFEHGVRHNGSYVLSDSAVTLSEMLKGKGYDTGAVVAAFPVDHRFGLSQGFDQYDDRFVAGAAAREGDTPQRPGTEVTRLALQWVDQHKGRPFFLWAHYFEPHAPYHPPEPFLSRFSGDPYSGEVACMDAAIGQLMDGLRSRGVLDRTLLVVVGDHGEGLGEHKELTHSTFIYGATQWVPFLLKLPEGKAFAGRAWRNQRIGGLVSLTDVLPTVWNVLGYSKVDLPRVSGKSLLPLICGNGAGHDWLYHETLVPDLDFGLSELRGLQTGRWKYIRAPQGELYDLDKDPQEASNLAAREKERVREMESQLQGILKGERGASVPVAMDQETIEKLRSLGYLQGAPSAPAVTRTDPKELPEVGMATARAQAFGDAGRPGEALAVLDSLLLVRPQTRLALRLRGHYLVQLGRGAEALDAYQKALDDCHGCPDEFRLLQEQTNAYLVAGKPDEAVRRVRVLIEARPKEQGLHLLLGEILETTGDTRGAAAAYATEAELFPTAPLPLVKLGNAEAAAGRTREAEQDYRKALSVRPQDPNALVMLSELLAKSGRAAEAGPLVDQALAVDPGNTAALYRKAWLLRDAGQKDAAVSHYRAALQGQPANGMLLYELGTLYGELGKNDEAVRCYEQAVGTASAPAGAYSNLGVMRAQNGRLKDAVQLWQQALSHKPAEQEAAIIRGNIQKAEEMLKSPAGKGR
jgi:arylsulfatase A-like enzyme/Tfp pilus assembly protein PilF